MPRLWLRKLTSIGAVADGDNPDAKIVLYKAREQKGVGLVEVDELEKQDGIEEGPDGAEAEAAAEAEAVAEVQSEGANDIEKRIQDAEAEIVKARVERDAALQALGEEVAKRRKADFAVKARTLEALLGPADETASILEALDAVAPEPFALLEKRLRAALERVNLTGEIGVAGDEGADPVRRRDAWVRKYVLDHPDVSEVKARRLFWKANPDAVEADREDH